MHLLFVTKHIIMRIAPEKYLCHTKCFDFSYSVYPEFNIICRGLAVGRVKDFKVFYSNRHSPIYSQK